MVGAEPPGRLPSPMRPVPQVGSQRGLCSMGLSLVVGLPEKQALFNSALFIIILA